MVEDAASCAGATSLSAPSNKAHRIVRVCHCLLLLIEHTCHESVWWGEPVNQQLRRIPVDLTFLH
jgi:hypothetical protein